MRPGVVAMTIALAIVFTAGWAVATADSVAAAKTRTCAGFSYKHKTAHMTYRFYKLRITGAPCSTIEKVVLGFFHNRGHAAGQVPTDGYDVYGWNVLLHTNSLYGVSGKRHFSGMYR